MLAISLLSFALVFWSFQWQFIKWWFASPFNDNIFCKVWNNTIDSDTIFICLQVHWCNEIKNHIICGHCWNFWIFWSFFDFKSSSAITTLIFQDKNRIPNGFLTWIVSLNNTRFFVFWMIDTDLTLTAIYSICESWIILIELNIIQEPSNIWLLIAIDRVQLF